MFYRTPSGAVRALLGRCDVFVGDAGSISVVCLCLRVGRSFVCREAANVARRRCPWAVYVGFCLAGRNGDEAKLDVLRVSHG